MRVELDFKDTVVAAFARRETQQPELVALREENAALKREKKQIVQETTRAVRELENTIRIYANQIQVLTLRNAELDDQLRRHSDQDASVIPVRPGTLSRSTDAS
ncbi:hypothetical protein ACBR40_27235 [Nonomuraea sp. AD125B]|uniref:hypothetical protein n=1 Tax=Nonomuraea sp. AD125B TaxID=3242897 RepID=UPI003528DAFF